MTIKQAKAIQYISEGDSVSKAMIKAGYRPATAKNSHKFTKSITFREMLENAGVTDEKLAQKLNEGLQAKKNGEPDYANQHKFLETSLRVKGHDKSNPIQPVIIPIYGGKSTINL